MSLLMGRLRIAGGQFPQVGFTESVPEPDLPYARQAIKVTRWRQNAKTKKISRESICVVTSLTSAEASPADLARLLREH